MEDIIDQSAAGNQEVPQTVKTLAILSIIGSSLWGLLILIAMIWIMTAASGMGIMGMSGASGGMAILAISFLIVIGLNVGSLIGAIRMMNGKKGFILYAICNGIWALLLLLSMGNQANPALTAITAIAGIGFIVAFGMQMKNMPK